MAIHTRNLLLTAVAGLIAMSLSGEASAAEGCTRTLTADVVALDQVFFYNRLGAVNPGGMIYALRRDVVDGAGTPLTAGGIASPGKVRLRDDKRPRPLVLRMNVGECLTIRFQNLLAPSPADAEQPATRTASIHVAGMQLVNGITDDGSNVGTNPSSLVAPGGGAKYTIRADREGGYLMYSGAAQTGGEGNGGSLAMGLFGAVNVQPAGGEYYRSQLTAVEMRLATKGVTPAGQPILNYDATYPFQEPWLSADKAGMPILNMVQAGQIVHSDLNAIITGPNRGNFPAGTYPPNRVNAPNTPAFAGAQALGAKPDRPREEPFREFSVIFHDEIFAIQFRDDLYEDAVLGHTLHSVRDGFAINYGTGGVGSEILANRFGVGPMADCNECKYEEFFLTSWAVGDPAMVVDIPASANFDARGNQSIKPLVATKALYPDDPSNVHHSYIGDHVKFRNIHAGPKEHHVFHLHAHQWLFTPDSDESAYLDSQAIGPGSAYTYEIAYNGAGNRNQTVGDAIFHCHFYPHFAQGMWEMWRNHDVFETGTWLDAAGRPAAGARALPDGEIAAGTPIPALVPVPTLAMPPMPGKVTVVADTDGRGSQIRLPALTVGPDLASTDVTQNPGYPFFIPGLSGHRPPHPPLDTIDDGGLPRHVVEDGKSVFPPLNRLDFHKDSTLLEARLVPEKGADVERVAMAFHARRTHKSYTPDGLPLGFVTNGLTPKLGAPFADPCIDDNGRAVGSPRLYRAAGIELDIVLNKIGDHFPQSRIFSLWEDVKPTLAGLRPPEPLFFRANTNDCIEYHLANLIPKDYQLDDFQVLTPTDVIGQHIHLVKFDVTSSDGSGNGWNYEDASFAPDEVTERIHAINAAGGLILPNGRRRILTPEPHPFFGTLGAQTTVQRWYADDVLNNSGEDRTLRTVFTHDHFGPSTHQQAGLYAGLVIEPKGSKWRDPETGVVFGGRADGGPTSWRADILTADPADSYREFLLEFADFQLAYNPGPLGQAGLPAGNFVNPKLAINPPGKREVGLPFLLAKPNPCPGGVAPPCPEAVSADDAGMFSVNYRNEPLAYRVLDPATGTQTAGLAGDLSHVYRSDIKRAIPALNSQPAFYPPLTADTRPGDPFTPLLRTYETDRVQIRVLVGAHEEGHVFSAHGIKWLREPSDPNSGYRNAQMMGISEHFEFVMPALSIKGDAPTADFLWQPDTSSDGQWGGIWGLLRAYNGSAGLRRDLLPLPSNLDGKAPKNVNPRDFKGICPVSAPVRNFSVIAATARQILPHGTLIYNSRAGAFPGNPGPLHDPTAILYVLKEDIDGTTGKLKAGRKAEPLVLRVNAGDCVKITLTNTLPAVLPDLAGFNTLPMIVEGFNNNQIRPSNHVGLHPQLLDYDLAKSDGANVGFNAFNFGAHTVPPGGTTTYSWYAGNVTVQPDGIRVATPIEFGATNLISADPIKQPGKGAIGALIVEPRGAVWAEDSGTRTSASVKFPTSSGTAELYREFVVQLQNDVNLRDRNGVAIPNTAEAEDPEDSGQKAINYRTEPFWFRKGFAPDTPLAQTRTQDFTNVLSNSQVGGDPETPVFHADASGKVRFRVLQPGGHPRNHAFQLHGHVWQREPYVDGSRRIGSNPLSEWSSGVQEGMGPANHFDMVLENGAGGAFGIVGDYLFRDQASFGLDGGMWGLLAVAQAPINTADLSITKIAPAEVGLSSNLDYHITVTNNGPADAMGVTMVDNLPIEVMFVSAMTSQGRACDGGKSVLCDLGIIASGGQISVVITVQTGLQKGTIKNTASVKSQNDPNLANNSDTVATTVGSCLSCP